MTKEVADKIVRGITDKIECNTVDIDDWAEFWGFTREEYEEFLDMAIKALEQQSRDCKTCKHSNNGKCAYTEKCHECMWENQYEPQRKRGKWIEVDICNCHATLKCSVCDRVIEPTFTFGEYSYENIKEFYPFCHCGADMRGDSE